MSSYSLDCTNMLNCNGSCENECKKFFQNSYMRPAVISTFVWSLKNGFELLKDIIKIYEEAIANQE